ncbi:MAG: carbohydrate binding domain-containing protein [Hellea sp.]
MFKRAILSITSAAFMSLLATTAVHAQDEFEQALKALDAQLPGTLINNPYDIKWKTEGSDKRDKVVESEGAPGGMAYQVAVKKRKPKPWDTATRIPMTTSIAKDDVILLSFWARAAKPQKGKDKGDISVAIQRNIEPYDAIFEERVALEKEWKLYNLAGKANRDYAADKTNLNFNLARAKQTLEFGQFYIMNLGPNGDASKYMGK